MPKPIDGGRAEDPIGKGIGPFRQIEVGSPDRTFTFVAFGDDIVEVFVLGALEGFKSKVIDDQKVDRSELGKVSVEAVGGPGGMELTEHFGDGCEEDIVTGSNRAMAQGLGDVALSGSAGTDDQDTDFLFDKATGSQVGDQVTVDVRIKGEFELFQSLLVTKVGSAEGRGQPLLTPASNFVGDDGG